MCQLPHPPTYRVGRTLPPLAGGLSFLGRKIMDRFAVMVDAGYFLRQSIEVVSRRASTQRRELDITDPAGLIALLVKESKAALGLNGRELLRVYWYDGVMHTGLTPQQRSIVELPDVSFRPGTVNSRGQQKGVDSLIVTDLIELAANQAVCDAAVVTGDGDLGIGIELAQKKGVRVALLGVEDLSVGISHHQSFEVTSRADRIARLGLDTLSPVMRHHAPAAAVLAATAAPVTLPPTPPASAQSAKLDRSLDEETKANIETLVKEFVATQSSLSGAVDPGTKRINSSFDRALIHHVFTALQVGKLTNAEKVFARACLRTELGQ